MRKAIVKLLNVITLIPNLFFAGYSFLVREEPLFGLVFLGLEAYYIMFLKKKLLYDNSEKEAIENAARIVYLWIFIFLFSYFLFIDISHAYILLLLPWVSFGLFLAWVIYTGRWNVLCSLLKKGKSKKYK